MTDYKKSFIEFMVRSEALQFGDFTLKSGRKSPFFMNAGKYNSASKLAVLGEYYARAVHQEYGDGVDVFFGPAYKGIPLCVTAAEAYYRLYGIDVRYCSDRKEAKDHGDKGAMIGSLIPGDRVVIIEDVTTSGKSIEETVPVIRTVPDVQIVGLMVSVDRGEIGPSGVGSALDEIRRTYGFDTAAIVTMKEVIEELYNRPVDGTVVIDDARKAELNAYYAEYGAE